jgi:polyphosphate glucokinase
MRAEIARLGTQYPGAMPATRTPEPPVPIPSSSPSPAAGKRASPARTRSGGPATLSVDVGGSGIKASVLDVSGQMEHERVRISTPYPLSPQKLVLEIQKLASELPSFDRMSVGFPGMVRAGRILSAPHFVSPDGPSGQAEPKLVSAWDRFDLAAALTDVTGKPTQVANDADIQGTAVVSGSGLEMVITLGTGLGTALFLDGRLMPHLELAHHPLSKGQTYNEVLGDTARKRVGMKRWTKRVLSAIGILRGLTMFDRLYVGGGNATRLSGANLPDDVILVSNDAGILGGIKLWEATGSARPPRRTSRA